MSDLSSALDTAFDEVAASEPASTTSSTPGPEAKTSAEKAQSDINYLEHKAEEKMAKDAALSAPAAVQDEEPTGDVLLDKLSPEQLAEVRKDPRLRAIYKGLMSSYTPKMQQMAEQARLWESLNNPATQRQAVEALARTVGLDIKPTDAPQREQAAAVADGISEEWSKVVGPEAGEQLRPLIEKTALYAVKGTLEPLQQAVEYMRKYAQYQQADALVSQFRSTAREKGWNITPEVEARMSELGQQVLPAKAIESVQEGMKHVERLYRLATADTAESDMEKRILERMNKAAQTAEPARGVPSTGREKRTNVTKEMSLNEAMDVAFEEAVPGLKMR